MSIDQDYFSLLLPSRDKFDGMRRKNMVIRHARQPEACELVDTQRQRYRSSSESCEGTNTEDLDVDFERMENQVKDEEDEDSGFSPELERMVTQED